MSADAVFGLIFHPRVVLKKQIRTVRPLRLCHPFHRLIIFMHPSVREWQDINIVTDPVNNRMAGPNTHYMFSTRRQGAEHLLDVLQTLDYPVQREPKIIKKFTIGPALSQS